MAPPPQLLLIARRSRDLGLLQLHGVAGPAVLDGYHRQVPLQVEALDRGIDDLANGPHCIDDGRACKVRHEPGDRLDLARSVGVRCEREHVGLAWFETDDRGLQHLREALVKQRDGGRAPAARRGQREMGGNAGETERQQVLGAGGLGRSRQPPARKPAPAPLVRSGW